MTYANKVFISYSHDNEKHKQWVLKLAEYLQCNGVDTVLDQWDLTLGADISKFMESGLSKSQRVLIVCTDKYIEKANAGEGGVGYEKMIVTAEMMSDIDTSKFIPVVRNVVTARKLPTFMGSRLYIDLSDPNDNDSNRIKLLRELLGEPEVQKPALGKSPFLKSMPISGEDRRLETNVNSVLENLSDTSDIENLTIWLTLLDSEPYNEELRFIGMKWLHVNEGSPQWAQVLLRLIKVEPHNEELRYLGLKWLHVYENEPMWTQVWKGLIDADPHNEELRHLGQKKLHTNI